MVKFCPPFLSPGQALKKASGFPEEENICYSTSQPIALARQEGEKKKYNPQVLFRCHQQTGLLHLALSSILTAAAAATSRRWRQKGESTWTTARPQQARGAISAPPGRCHPGPAGPTRAPHPRDSQSRLQQWGRGLALPHTRCTGEGRMAGEPQGGGGRIQQPLHPTWSVGRG